MGYRNYFNLIEIEKVKELQTLNTFDEGLAYAIKNGFDDDGEMGWIDRSFLIGEECVHEFGKLYYCDTIDRIHSKGEKLFKEELDKEFGDYDMHLVGKEGLLEAINCYRDKIENYYDGLLKENVQTYEDRMKELVREKMFSLKYNYIDLENKYKITQSWEYEHSIFNLVYLYKTIDWDKYTLVFYGC